MTDVVINDASTGYLTITFLNKDSEPQAPISATYRIDCLTTGAVVKDDTALGAGSAIELELSKIDNAMQNAANKSERRVLTVTANYGDNDAARNAYTYVVRNLAVW